MNEVVCKCNNVFIPKQIFKTKMDNGANPRSTISLGRIIIKYCICPKCNKVIDIK